MAISILGGFLKGYNEDKALEKEIEANALALGRQSIIERNAALDKRKYDEDERRDFDDYKRKKKS